MSQFPRPPMTILPARGGAAGGEGRPVTSAVLVSATRRFPQSLLCVGRRGRPVTPKPAGNAFTVVAHALERTGCSHVASRRRASCLRRRRSRHFFPQVIWVRAVDGDGRYQPRHSQQRRRGGAYDPLAHSATVFGLEPPGDFSADVRAWRLRSRGSLRRVVCCSRLLPRSWRRMIRLRQCASPSFPS